VTRRNRGHRTATDTPTRRPTAAIPGTPWPAAALPETETPGTDDPYAANVTEGALRVRYRNSFEEPSFVEPGTVYEVSVDLRDVAHTFQAGHRIRLGVTSSNFPKLDRNPNAAVPVAEATADDMTTAAQTLYHDADRPSRVELSVV